MHEEASAAMLHALPFCEVAYGLDHLNVAGLLYELSCCLIHLKRCKRALPYLKRAQAIVEPNSSQPVLHSNVLQALIEVYTDLKDFASAEATMEQRLLTFEHSHPLAANCMFAMGALLHHAKQSEKALPWLQRAEIAVRQNLGSTPAEVVAATRNRAIVEDVVMKLLANRPVIARQREPKAEVVQAPASVRCDQCGKHLGSLGVQSIRCNK
jgi:hypothetical protein